MTMTNAERVSLALWRIKSSERSLMDLVSSTSNQEGENVPRRESAGLSYLGLSSAQAGKERKLASY